MTARGRSRKNFPLQKHPHPSRKIAGACAEIFVNGGGAQTHSRGRGGALCARKHSVIPSSPARTARGGVVEESQRRQTEKQGKRSFGCTALRAAPLRMTARGRSRRPGVAPLARTAEGKALAGSALQPSTTKKHGTNVPCFFVVEMIRLELTTYTLRTYRSTG